MTASSHRPDLPPNQLKRWLGGDGAKRRILFVSYERELDGVIVISALEGGQRPLFFTKRVVDQRDAEPGDILVAPMRFELPQHVARLVGAPRSCVGVAQVRLMPRVVA